MNSILIFLLLGLRRGYVVDVAAGETRRLRPRHRGDALRQEVCCGGLQTYRDGTGVGGFRRF